MTQVEWLRKQKAHIQKAANTLSENTLKVALSHEQYLQNVGAYRTYRLLIANFDALIQKIQGADDESDADAVEGPGLTTMDDDEDDFDPPTPRARKPQRRRPREWGG